MSTTTTTPKPLLLFTAFAGDGHAGPLSRIAAGLIHRGYEVAFLVSQPFEDKIRATGAEYFDTPSPFTPALFEALAKHVVIPIGPTRFALQIAKLFWETLPGRTARMGETLEVLRARDPERQIIIVEDSANLSTIPWRYGRPLPKGFDTFPKTLGVSPAALMMEGIDVAPPSLGLPPDSTPSGRLRNQALTRILNEGAFRPFFEAREKVFAECDCTSLPEHSPTNSWWVDYDTTLILCSPSLDYPRSDKPSSIEFVGCLPRQPISPDLKYPEWWPEILSRGDLSSPSYNKKVVFVTQGTVSFNPQELILPTIAALAHRTDIIVIVLLGRRDAQLENSATLPANVRVIDYFPYDAILQHTDVFVSNAGYGGFTHAVINGVPAVFAGQSEDKAEVSARAEWAGFAKDLRTQTPTAPQIREAVEEVLVEERYKARAVELKVENERMDSLSLVEDHILRMTE